jgi:hypothetical protein
MQKSPGLIMAAMLGCALLVATESPSSARRIIPGSAVLNMCNANFDSCHAFCIDWSALPPPTPCLAMCSANHAVCVDAAYDPAVVRHTASKKARHAN